MRAVQGDPQGLLRRRRITAIGLHDGPTEFPQGLSKKAVYLVRNRQTDRQPFVNLGPKDVDRAAGKFQGQVIRFPALDQRAGGKGQQAVTFHVPGDRYGAGIRDVALQHQLALVSLGIHDPRGAIDARHIGKLQHFFRDALRRRDNESHLPHKNGNLLGEVYPSIVSGSSRLERLLANLEVQRYISGMDGSLGPAEE